MVPVAGSSVPAADLLGCGGSGTTSRWRSGSPSPRPITVQAVASICGSYFCSRSLSRLGPFALPQAAGRRSPRLRERRPGEPSPGMPAAGVTPDWVDAAWRPCGGFRAGAPALRKQPVGSASMARRWTPSEDVALRLAAALDWEHGGRRRGLVPRGRHHFFNERRTDNEERSTQRNRPLNRIMSTSTLLRCEALGERSAPMKCAYNDEQRLTASLVYRRATHGWQDGNSK